MNNKRPVNLNLTTIKFPIPAIASISHRISGVLLFLFIPLLIWMLGVSLESEAGFQQMKDCFTSFFGKIILWVMLSSLIFHVLAGFRHLLMDVGCGESLAGGRLGAKLVFAMAAVLILLTSYWIWT